MTFSNHLSERLRRLGCVDKSKLSSKNEIPSYDGFCSIPDLGCSTEQEWILYRQTEVEAYTCVSDHDILCCSFKSDTFEQMSIRRAERKSSVSPELRGEEAPVLTCRVYDCMQSGLIAKRVSNLAHRL